MNFDDVRKSMEATLGNLTPAKARELAKSMTEPGAARDQVSKTASDILDWSQKNRERLRTAIRKEISEQMGSVGVATQKDLDAVKKRVRELERRAGMTASGRKKTAARKKTTARSGGVAGQSSGQSARKSSGSGRGGSSGA